jgi:hypothetical protein
MISVIPALDFVRSLCGNYKAEAGQAELRVWACGYGVALDLRGEKKTEFVGVVGASNGGIECFGQVGLPNVVRFVGGKTSETQIQLAADDLPLIMKISKEAGLVRVVISLNNVEKVSYAMQAA